MKYIIWIVAISCHLISCKDENQPVNQPLPDPPDLTTYYVAPAGDDRNDGTLEAPFQSLHRALPFAEAGDSIIIREGNYEVETWFEFENDGTAEAPIIVMAMPGENVIFNAVKYEAHPSDRNPSRFHNYGVFHFEGVSHIKLIGIRIFNARGAGIMVRGENTSHIDISECEVNGAYSSGIALWYADSCRVHHNVITRVSDLGLQPSGANNRSEAPHEALTVAGATHFEVDHNEIYLCDKEGIDVKEVSANGRVHHNICYNNKRQGLYVDSWFGRLHHVEFDHNIVYNCEWGMAISAEGENSSMDHIQIHHNLLYNNRGSGIFFGVWGHDERRENLFIYNNTVYGNGNPTHWAGPTGGLDLRSSNVHDTYIFNNIFSQNAAYEMATFDDPAQAGLDELNDQNIHIEYNLVHLPTDQTSHQGAYAQVYMLMGAEAITGDPEFMQPGVADFSLQPGSPAWNAGHPDPPIATKADLTLGAFIQ